MASNRTSPQNRALHALCEDVASTYPLIPYRRAFACEAWKRFLIAAFVRELRWEAFHAGNQDPFPARPVPSRNLSTDHMSALLDFSNAWCAQHGVEVQKTLAVT